MDSREGERSCEDILQDTFLQTPPSEHEKTRKQQKRKPKEFKLPPRFPLLTKEFYAHWGYHRKELHYATAKVDNKPPVLYPYVYLRPQKLEIYAKQMHENMNEDKELIKRINIIQRTGGYVDCWMKPEPTDRCNRMLLRQRQTDLDKIDKANTIFYHRLQNARSEELLTKKLEQAWKETKHKLIHGAVHPFVLFKTEKLDRGIKDSAFDKSPYVNRVKVIMDMALCHGSKIGKVTIELFNEIVPETCQLFLNLVMGDGFGHAYRGTRFFRVVPNLYCRGGDVVKDNGYGLYIPRGERRTIVPENFQLKHSVPGVLSMAVTKDKEVSGQFNIIFKPLPQFDGKHVVFGRIVAGPNEFLERISALGLPLGTTTSSVIIKDCGYYGPGGQLRYGISNTNKFPPRRKTAMF